MDYKRRQNEERQGRSGAWLVFALLVTVAGAATCQDEGTS